MQTRREYLAGLNPPLAKANSRGRLSGPAHAAIDEAVKNGIRFSDMPQSHSDKQIDSKNVSRNSETDVFSATPEPFFTGGWYAFIDGKKTTIHGNSVCSTCGYSLDYQNCLVSETVGPNAEMVRVMR